MIAWKDPKLELPPAGQVVAVIYSHGKQRVPHSLQIMFGEVESNEDRTMVRVCSDDFTGVGNWSVYLRYPDYTRIDDIAVAWCDPKELQIPLWIKHDNHWGPRG